jgi:RNA recognition motif-containing protein
LSSLLVLKFSIPISQFIVATHNSLGFSNLKLIVTMNIYVGNLSWTMTEDDLRSLFEQYGTVSSVKIVKDRETGRSRGFGFVDMPDDNQGQQALTSLYDTEVMGRKIIVNESQTKPEGGGGGFKKRNFGGGGGGGYNKGGGGGGYKKGGFNRGGGGGYNRDY